MPAGPSSLGNRGTIDGPIVKPKGSATDGGVPPLIRRRAGAGGAPASSRPLIAIGGSPRRHVEAQPHVDPFQFWMDYYKTHHDESPGTLHETVRLLGANRKMVQVEAALKGYLTYHGNNAEAWMYRALAMVMQMNKRSPVDVKTALNYSADLAQKSHNPNDLVSVADTMILMGHLDRVGKLLDEASARIPHRAEPFWMSVLLAQKLLDPARMTSSIENLLSLGWPGKDDTVRTECRRQVETFASALRNEGRTAEAASVVDRLSESLTRDVYIRLTWNGYADFDLAVDEPLGVTASYDLPRTVFGGSIVKNGYGSHPKEVYVCPRGFDGDYKIHIRNIWTDPKQPVTGLKLETIVHEGTARQARQVHELKPNQLNQTFVIHLSGGRRTKVLPYINPQATDIQYQAKGRPAPRHSKARKPGK